MTKTVNRTGAVSALAISSLLGASSLLAVSVAVPAAAAATVPHSYLVFFDFNKSNLTPEAVKIVDQAAADAAAGKATQIVVTGYTDTVGSDAYNMRLSKRRALSVQAELAKQGVPADAVAIYAKGKHDLLVPTGDGVKEPQNRRASIAFDTPAPAAPPPPAAEAAAPAAPPGFQVWAQLEAGITANPNAQWGGINYGHLFTDKANQPVLNQLLVTAEKPLDPNATDYDVGFRVQGMFGSDARYTHFLGELDTTITGTRYQLDIVEANLQVHTPWLFDGGIDFKIGQYPTYLGAETIDPSGNYLYSKSYIFNFGIPLKHTGFMSVSHINPTLDIYLGLDTGVNTTFGDGDNNSAFAFQGGFGLNNLLDGKLTVLALTHIGPENPVGPPATVPLPPSILHPNSAFRFLNDIVMTYKWSDALTTITELNYIEDEAFHARAYGIAEYAKYQLDETVALVGRGEIFRDNNNFFVAAFPGNNDFVNLERGFPLERPLITAFGPTTYGEITLGLNITPPMPTPIQALTIRPEFRFDGALNGRAPFNGDSTQVTFGLDFILKI
jgi:hypothetical protein